MKLLLEVLCERSRWETSPSGLELRSHLVVGGLLIFQELVHLLNHVEIVVSNGGETLDHTLHVAVAALLLVIFNLFPEGRGDLSGRSCSMEGLREAIGSEEFLLLNFTFLFTLILLVNDFLEFLFNLDLHDSNLRWDDVS